ncbi:hypothetical protein B0O99DRAFT_684565 [Bisporella sp. PMI_857]|nr:hypothetical protein B0O99DRAFT_684565 [Bisporella sp. PMI_857]
MASSPITYLPTTVPVFCTSNIPGGVRHFMIDHVLSTLPNGNLAATYHDLDRALVRGGLAKLLHRANSLLHLPLCRSDSAEVNAIFLERIAPVDLLTNRLFVILDEQSVKDDSCLIVHGGKDFDPDDEMTFLRTDFFVAMNMVSRAEMGVTDLGENLNRDRV